MKIPVDLSDNTVPQDGWFVMENHVKMDDLGVPLFEKNQKTSKFGVYHVLRWNCTRPDLPALTVSPWAPARPYGPSPHCSKQVPLPGFSQSTAVISGMIPLTCATVTMIPGFGHDVSHYILPMSMDHYAGFINGKGWILIWVQLSGWESGCYAKFL